jgi:plastocyanin
LKRKYIYVLVAVMLILAATYPVIFSVYAGTIEGSNHFVCPPLLPCNNSPVGSLTCSGFCVVEIQNLAFSPGNLTITVGTTVEWVNMDSQAHTSTCYSSSICWSSPTLIQPGGSYNYTFSNLPTGTYYYQCQIHPVMQGEINLVPAGST